MNINSFIRSRRFRYGSMSAIITALVIVAVIILNAIFSALTARYLWYVDLSKDDIYTVSDICFEQLDMAFEKAMSNRQEGSLSQDSTGTPPAQTNGGVDIDQTIAELEAAHNNDDGLKVTIRFCDLYDNLMSDASLRYVLMTALALQKHYPDIIEVVYTDIWENPSAVEKYRTTTLSPIYSTDVIVASGDEYKLYGISDFYLTSSGATTPWAFIGERRLAAGIMTVIKAERPIAGILMGHGEAFSDTALIELLDNAGFQLEIIDDLTTYEFSENCRLLVCYNPTSDFMTSDSASEKSEITVLDNFLSESSHSLMVFMSPSSPVLPNLESYLDIWGISFMRHTDLVSNTYPCMVKDSAVSLSGDGLTVIGQYETEGIGASITTDMRTVSFPAKVIFKNAMPIAYSDEYQVMYTTDDNGQQHRYATKNIGEISRGIYPVFNSTSSAVAVADGRVVKEATELDTFSLMTISSQSKTSAEDNYSSTMIRKSSYVLACGSTEFTSRTMLESAAYGNANVLLKALHSMGIDNVAAMIPLHVLASSQIQTLTVERANSFTSTLAILPAAIVFGVGVFVIVRRKYS